MSGGKRGDWDAGREGEGTGMSGGRRERWDDGGEERGCERGNVARTEGNGISLGRRTGGGVTVRADTKEE